MIMTEAASPTEAALATRLRAIAPFLLGSSLPDQRAVAAADVADTLELLVESVVDDPANDRIWLLLTAVCAAYPTRSEVDKVRRQFELADPSDAVILLLDTCISAASTRGESTAGIDIVVGGIVVDVDHSAKFDLHTGIQRVTRSLLPEWSAKHEIVPTAWTRSAGALRHLEPIELARVVAWPTHEARSHSNPPAEVGSIDSSPPRLVVPWRSVVVMAEVPPGNVSDSMAAIGDYSGNHLVGIAYDSIPVVSADMVPAVETSKFVRYLTCLKFASRMAGISKSAASEIAGFVEALNTQGLSGPKVVEVSLASPRADFTGSSAPDAKAPIVLVVGSHEPRKNHIAILHSAENLWRDGLQFSVLFIGGSGWGDEFPRRIAELHKAGRPITVRRAVSEAELEDAYAAASFTVFPSLHEGFGLPVAESLAHGVPVITSDFGSTAEIAAGGGALVVNPHNDAALTEAIRTLLTDRQALAKLREEIERRPERSWQQYADELWELLIEPELATVKAQTSNVI